MSYQKLLPVIGGNDLESNINKIATAITLETAG